MMTLTKSIPMIVNVALLFATLSLPAAADSVRLQVLVTSDRTKAEGTAAQLEAAGAGPAVIQESHGQYKVQSKPYESIAEANFAKPALRGAGFTDVFIATEPQTEPQSGTGAKASVPTPQVFGEAVPSIVTQSTFDQLKIDFKTAKTSRKGPKITPQQEELDDKKAPERELFAKASGYWKKSQTTAALESFGAYIRRFPNSDQVAKAKLMRAYWLNETSDTVAARQQFEAVMKDHAAQPEAGEAALRIAYLLLRQKSDGDALRLFHAIASGKYPCTEDVRAEAMLRTAALFHRGKDLDRADACYAAISTAFADENIKAFAGMQRAALAMEKAWNQKGTFGQARELCDQVLTKHPNADKATRATVSLMKLETLCYEKKYAEAVALEKTITAEASGTQIGRRCL